MKLKLVYPLVLISIFFSCASPTEQENINGGSSVELLPNLNLEDGIEVVTWNIEFFPKLGQRTMDSVQKIIKTLNADIYCLQEISSRNSFEELAESLTEYDFVISEDTDYLNLVVLYKKNDFVVRSQSSLFTNSVYEFAYRPPLRLEMTYLGQNAFDFTLINMHLKCCNNGYDRRKASVDILYDYLNNSVQSGIVNHIVVGDWNDDISLSLIHI